MKKFLRAYLINLLSLIIASDLITSIHFAEGFRTTLIATFVLTFVNILVKPIINLLLLPINLITLGTFRFLVNVISLYFVTVIVPQFSLSAFFFPGFVYQGFVFPSLNIGIFGVYVLTSFIISLCSTFLLWLSK